MVNGLCMRTISVQSSKLHQFEDIGVPVFLRVRERSCHRCPDCWAGKSEYCCCMDMQEYPSELAELKPLTVLERAVTQYWGGQNNGEVLGQKVPKLGHLCNRIILWLTPTQGFTGLWLTPTQGLTSLWLTPTHGNTVMPGVPLGTRPP